jgi:pyruvyl transferase EpsO
VVWLRRSDREQAERPDDRSSPVDPTDWPDHWGFAQLRNAGRLQGHLTGRVPGLAGVADRRLQLLYERVATRRVRLGLAMIAPGRMLVTDRLHGHILACLLGRPNVVVDNSYGKVGAFVERWTKESPLVHRADGHAEALALALDLDPGGGGSRG